MTLELRAVSKTYGVAPVLVTALANVNLQVGQGQFVSIMGPSGSGKSTLLNIISALDTPTQGSVIIEGQDIAKLDDDALTLFRRRHIGLVFQFFNLLPTLSALDNVLLPVMLERRPTSADRERAASLLEQVGLGARQTHHIHQLSGGEMQRVAIARALVMRPRLILADEPTGNLDTTTSAAILALFKELSVSAQTTVVMVTHDPKASQVGNRVVWIKDGRIHRDEPTNVIAAE